MSEPPTEPGKGNGGSFWTSLSGVMTAAATLLTAVVGACALVYQIAKDDPASQSAPPGQSAAQPDQDTTQTRAPRTTAAAVDVATALWHDTLSIGNSGVDFDVSPPNTKGGGALDIYDAGNVLSSPGDNIAKWTKTGQPTAADCADVLDRNAVNNIRVDVGVRFCLRTTKTGRIVYIRVLGENDDRPEVEATVWAAP
ncbi:hypothetical protein [Luedemannella helvata]|uniref:Serine/threonine protein kinase n=1 Tax=Luedemannella helvata TaxID=349315 RepID=A0ABN2KF36_9ACTN